VRSAAAAAVLAFASGCSGDAPPPSLPPLPPRPAGHVRMIETLREVAERTERDNAFLGRGPTDEAKAALDALPADAPPVARMNAVFRLADNQVRIGEARAAIRTLESGRAVLPTLEPGAYEDAPFELEFRLGDD